jgi:hypothetical protein
VVGARAELRLAILLCSHCGHKFDYKRYHYSLDREYQVQGDCDAKCGRYCIRDSYFFMPEELLGVTWPTP